MKKYSQRSHMCQISQLILSSFNLWSQVVFCVTLRDMLDQRAVIREEIGSDMNRLGVPNFAILQTILLGIKRGQEAELSANAEVGDDHIERLVQELVLRYLSSKVASQSLLSSCWFGGVVGTGAGCHQLVRSVLLTNSR